MQKLNETFSVVSETKYKDLEVDTTPHGVHFMRVVQKKLGLTTQSWKITRGIFMRCFHISRNATD